MAICSYHLPVMSVQSGQALLCTRGFLHACTLVSHLFRRLRILLPSSESLLTLKWQHLGNIQSFFTTEKHTEMYMVGARSFLLKSFCDTLPTGMMIHCFTVSHLTHCSANNMYVPSPITESLMLANFHMWLGYRKKLDVILCGPCMCALPAWSIF